MNNSIIRLKPATQSKYESPPSPTRSNASPTSNQYRFSNGSIIFPNEIDFKTKIKEIDKQTSKLQIMLIGLRAKLTNTKLKSVPQISADTGNIMIKYSKYIKNNEELENM